MHVDISEFLIYVAVGLIGWTVRHVRSIRKWRRIRSNAKAILADPQATSDPQVALVAAVVEDLAPRIRRESISILKTNGVADTDRAGPRAKAKTPWRPQ